MASWLDKYAGLNYDDLQREADSFYSRTDDKNQGFTSQTLDGLFGRQASPLMSMFGAGGSHYQYQDGDGGSRINFHDSTGPEDYNVSLTRGADGKVVATPYQKNEGIPWEALAIMALPVIGPGGLAWGAGEGAAAAGLGEAAASGASGFAGAGAAGAGEMSLADAMAAYAPEYGAEISAAGMGAESLPALETLGVDSAGGLAYGSANSGAGGLATAQNLGKLISAGSSLTSGSAGAPKGPALGNALAGFGAGNNVFNQQQPQMNVMPTFGPTPVDQSGYATELGNSQNIKQLAQALMANKGNIYG